MDEPIYKKATYLIMDSRKISALLTSVDLGSLTSAAAELGYTQSGLTHMMNSLEDELGINLLIRSKGGVKLSAAGHSLLPQMKKFMSAADELDTAARRMRESSSSLIRIGAYSSVARFWLPTILSKFKENSPDTNVTVTMSSIDNTYEAVRSGSLDCAFVSYQKSMMQGLNWVALRDDELVAVLPADYPAEGNFFPVEKFAGQEFLMPSMGFELDIMPALENASMPAPPIFRNSNLDDASIVSMVEHGLGVSVLSELCIKGIGDYVKAVPLAPRACRKMGVIMSDRQPNDRNIRRIIRIAQDTLKEMYGQ